MAKHRAVIIGAGRIGAGYNWHDDAYTHAGAYRSMPDRVELVGFVEPDLERRVKANLKWKVPTYENCVTALPALKPDIVSICVQPDHQNIAFDGLMWHPPAGVWCEKPYISHHSYRGPIQVNYMRRADVLHRQMEKGGRLVVYAKDDIHTRCHFEDLAEWWEAELDYRAFNGPCAYLYDKYGVTFFDNGGVDGGTCFKAMLTNLLDHIDKGDPLWSPVK